MLNHPSTRQNAWAVIPHTGHNDQIFQVRWSRWSRGAQDQVFQGHLDSRQTRGLVLAVGEVVKVEVNVVAVVLVEILVIVYNDSTGCNDKHYCYYIYYQHLHHPSIGWGWGCHRTKNSFRSHFVSTWRLARLTIPKPSHLNSYLCHLNRKTVKVNFGRLWSMWHRGCKLAATFLHEGSFCPWGDVGTGCPSIGGWLVVKADRLLSSKPTYWWTCLRINWQVICNDSRVYPISLPAALVG